MDNIQYNFLTQKTLFPPPPPPIKTIKNPQKTNTHNAYIYSMCKCAQI